PPLPLHSFPTRRSSDLFSTFPALHEGDDVDPQEFARLIDFYDNSFRNLAEGEVVKGTVVKVTPTEVIVDVGFKSEGIIPIEEFIDRKSTRLNSSHDQIS